MNIFDWKQCEETSNNPRRVQWLLENCEKEVSQEEFVNAMTLIKFFKKGLLKSRYCPSALKCEYKRLKHKFGFFTGKKIK